MLSPAHARVGHPYPFFGDASIQTLCPFNLLVFLWLIYKRLHPRGKFPHQTYDWQVPSPMVWVVFSFSSRSSWQHKSVSFW